VVGFAVCGVIQANVATRKRLFRFDDRFADCAFHELFGEMVADFGNSPYFFLIGFFFFFLNISLPAIPFLQLNITTTDTN
jgi:hypothetical protein